jgi:HTH-like domain/Integrase core domain
MGLPRSTFYDVPAAPVRDVELVAKIVLICDEFETYGYRRVRAELRHQGFVVNGKKIRRLMRKDGLQPKRRRRYVITTNSDHESPIFHDLARDQKIDGPNQLWVADITYIAIETGFVYLAVILDAWSRRLVGYAISRSVDACLAIAALKSAIHCPASAPMRQIGLVEEGSDCLAGQVEICCHERLSRNIALRIVMSLRATATRATSFGFPAATSLSRKLLSCGL